MSSGPSSPEEGEYISGKRSKPEASDDDNDSEFDDGYDDDLIADQEDRERLDNMPEIDREKVLAERFERRQQMKSDWEFRQQAKMQSRLKQKQQNKEKKSTATAVAVEKKISLRDRVLSESSQSESSDGGHSASESESEDEIQERDSKAKARRARSLPDLKDIQSICIKRDQLKLWYRLPIFPANMVGSVVRVYLGKNSRGTPSYAMSTVAEIRLTDYTYNFEGKPYNVYLVLETGNSRKKFQISAISNASLRADEYERWKKRADKDAKEPITFKDLPNLIGRIDEMREYLNDPRKFSEMVEKNRRDGLKKGKVFGKIKAEEADLREKIFDMKLIIAETHDALNREKYEELLHDLEDQYETVKKLLVEEEDDDDGEQDALLKFNEKNRRAQMDKDLNQTVAARKKLESAEFDSQFSRRECRPMNLWKTGAQSATPTKEDKVEKSDQQESLSPSKIRLSLKQTNEQKKQQLESFHQMELSIDKNLDQLLSANQSNTKRATFGSNWANLDRLTPDMRISGSVVTFKEWRLIEQEGRR